MRTLLVMLSLLWGTAQATDWVIKNATVHWPNGEKTVNTHLLIRDGVLVAAGPQVDVPKGTKQIDGKNLHVTAGLFNANTHIGLEEVSLVNDTVDFAAENDLVTASLRVADAFNPSSATVLHNRTQGITHALILPEAGGSLIAGQAALVNLSASRHSVEKQAVGVVVSLGQDGKKLAGGSRAAAMALLREALMDAKDYARHKEDYQRRARRDYQLSRADLEALEPVVTGQLPLIVRVHRAADILVVLDLAETMDIRIVLLGAEEGWRVADEIAKAKVPVIIDPTANTPASFERLGARSDNATYLHKAGVTLLFTGIGWQTTHNAFLVRQAAGNAVANGLPYDAAMAAMTSNLWKVFGGHGAGLQLNRPADLVVWDGDPLEVTTEVEAVFLDGQFIPLVSHATLLRDRYAERYQLIHNSTN